MTSPSFDIPRFAIVAVLLAWVLAAGPVGCGSAMPMTAAYAGAGGGDTSSASMSAAQSALSKSDVAGAQNIYSQLLVQNPESGAAAAGEAITDILLLPGSDQITKILTADLGASRGINANSLIYQKGGFLYWLSRGARWQDDGSYLGIRSLLADQLPWPSQKLDSVADFVAGLAKPVDDMMSNLVYVADSMQQIEDELQIAIKDPTFRRIYIPGSTFHDDNLSLVLGKSELAVIQSTVAMTRAAIYFVAAYQNDWTLQDALGAHWQTVANDPQSPDYRDGWQPSDYTLHYLDKHVLRAVTHPARLTKARNALSDSLKYARESIDFGLNSTVQTSLRWSQVDSTYAQHLSLVLKAIQASLFGATAIPYTKPATKMNLSVFFKGSGRALPASVPWLVRTTTQTTTTTGSTTGSATTTSWQIDDAATQQFFVDGVFSPSWDVSKGNGPTFQLSGNPATQFENSLTGSIQNNVKNVYFTTQ